MLMRRTVTTFMLLTTVSCGFPARTAQAGPLFDWLFFGHHRQQAAPAYAVGYPVPVAAGYAPYVAGYSPYVAGYVPTAARYTPYTAPYTAAYAPTVAVPAVTAPAVTAPAYYGTYYGANMPVVGGAGYGYMTQRPVDGVIAPTQAVMPSTAPVTLVPDYRTTTSRTPVTYYRPLMTTDPTTGQQVVTMAPCTSYEYQTQRVPTLGLTQVFNGGATLPATTAVAPPVAPTYTLPRGGVPLAGPLPSTQPYATAYGTYPAAGTTSVVPVAPTTGSIITPATPYSAGYPNYASNAANYSALQPSVAAPSGSVYPTAPLGSAPAGLSPYYSSPTSSGGSCGNYAPQSQVLGSTGSAPYSGAPYANSPGTTYGAPPTSLPPGSTLPASPVVPPSGSMPSGSPVLPPSGDPAAGNPPTLPLPGQSSARLDSRPQLQSVVQQPIAGNGSTSQSSASSSGQPSSKPTPATGLMPIPVPEDFKHEPRWNPGLLSERDQTAAHTTGTPSSATVDEGRDPAAAWGSKPIQWASFKQPIAGQSELSNARGPSAELELSAPKSGLRDMSPVEALRPLGPPAQRQVSKAPAAVEEGAGQTGSAARGGSAAQADFVPLNVPMVPIERALAPATGSGLELSPSYAAPPAVAPAAAPAAASVMPAVPAQSGRYRTTGWQ